MMCKNRFKNIPIAMTIAVALLANTTQAAARDSLTWPQKKCALYTDAWDSALLALDQSDISQEFHKRNQTFIDSGCTARINVCPHSDTEFEIANLLTIMTMNEGMASTFVPFNCPADQ